MEAKKKLVDHARAVRERLVREVPSPHVELKFDDAWQLVIATIMAAQSTDKMVNKVMPEVLKRWPDPASLASSNQEEVEEVIKSTGFFRNKAKAIRETSRVITERFGGRFPKTMEEALELPGVARKTANVVLGAAYGMASGVVVDTHVARVSQRLALTRQKRPEKIEDDLCALYPRDQWIGISHRIVLHGRHVCTAKSPRCEECPLNEICPARESPPKGSWTQRADELAKEMESRAEGFARVEKARD
jgi:endonuclease-3